MNDAFAVLERRVWETGRIAASLSSAGLATLPLSPVPVASLLSSLVRPPCFSLCFSLLLTAHAFPPPRVGIAQREAAKASPMGSVPRGVAELVSEAIAMRRACEQEARDQRVREAELHAKEAALVTKERSLTLEEQWLREREKSVSEHEAELARREKDLVAREEEIESRAVTSQPAPIAIAAVSKSSLRLASLSRVRLSEDAVSPNKESEQEEQ
jgi:hypothetical protein